MDSTTGKLIQSSGITVDDSNNITGVASETVQTSIVTAVSAESVSTDSSTTGSNATLATPTTPIVRLTNASLASISMLAAGSQGQVVTIVNLTGTAVTINDETGATAANRFRTGTKSGLSLADTASITVKYDTVGSRWMVIGGSGSGSGSGGINYILTPNAESGIVGWATYADAASTSPVDGTGGSPTSTFTTTSTSPLRGLNSFLFSKPASNRQGDGFSYDFTIDASDKGKVLQCSFEYQIASGTFADNDLSVWIYDVTNASLIQPAPYLIKNSGIIEKFAVEFQTASNSTSYRLIVHVGSTSASAYTMKFDNFILGPQAKLYGSAIGEPVSVTPTGTWVTNTTYSGKVTRIGPFGKFDLKVTLSGAPTAATLDITLPSGYAIDTSKLENPNNNNFNLGTLNIIDNSAGIGYSGIVRLLNSTSIRLHPNGTAGSFTDIVSPLNATTPITFASADIIDISFTVPIQGWSSSQVFSQDASSRVVAALIGGGTASATANNPIIYSTVGLDTHGAYSTVTGKYTVPVSGYYNVNASGDGTAAAGTFFYVSVNGNTTAGYNRPVIAVQEVVNQGFSGSGKVFATAGQTIDIRATNAAGSISSFGTFQIERISGPAQVAASESVACNYVTTAGQSIPNNTVTTVLYGTKIHDSHNAYNTSTGIFTAPMSGVYTVSASIDYTPNNTTGYRAIHAVGNLIDRTLLQMNALSIYQQVAGSTTFRLLAGQTINVYAVHTKGSSETLTASDASNYMSIYRIGNY